MAHSREPVLVALHGLTGSPERMRRYLPELPGVAVIVPELPGHGRAPLPPEFTREAVVGAVARELRELGIGAAPRVHLVGMSLGAAVARTLAASGELPVASVVLIRPAHVDRPTPVHLLPNEIVSELLAADPASARERLEAMPYFRALAEESPSTAANILAKTVPGAAAEIAARIRLLREGSRWVAEGSLAAVPLRLVIGAARDALHPLAVAELWRRDLDAELAVVADPADPAHDGQVRELVAGVLAGETA